MQNSNLYIIGAGLGDPELLTLKAAKILQQAQIVFYDALVHPAILDHAANAEHVYVGKRKSHKAYTQEEIHQLILTAANKYHTIVRLKGGDPYVFGRGYEELEYAAQHGIITHYIPGISSAIAGPGIAGIPVTYRNISRSFWVLTATSADGSLNNEIETAAHTEATVVILMGLAKLAEITAVYKAAHKSKTPIAVIQNASRTDENICLGTIDNITLKTKLKELYSPAIIIIGEVVRLHKDYENSSASEDQNTIPFPYNNINF